jgi:hypothetical protein
VDETGNDVKAIFIAALDREPGAERAAYLDSACGDRVDLRRRVEALLAAHERADEVFGPAVGSAGASATAAGTARPPAGPEIESTQAAATQATANDATVGLVTTYAGGATASRGGNGLARGTPVRYFGDYEIEAELGRGGKGLCSRHARSPSTARWP